MRRRYKLELRSGEWLIYDRDMLCYLDRFDNLPAAHDWATACAITDECFRAGGLKKFDELKKAAERWLSIC